MLVDHLGGHRDAVLIDCTVGIFAQESSILPPAGAVARALAGGWFGEIEVDPAAQRPYLPAPATPTNYHYANQKKGPEG
ncbi:MAG: hypothetical protein VCA35_04515, partial [Roseibacillus sp.]